MTTEKTLFDEVFMAALGGCLSSGDIEDPYDSAILYAKTYFLEREQLLKEVYGRG